MTESHKSGLPGAAASRLRQAGGSGVSKAASTHPEANLLAAFTEQALSATERDEVLTHLAQCADCREIVAVSLSAAEEGIKPEAEASPGWFGMRPEFTRWMMVGASAAVVVAAVWLVRPELQAPPRMDNNISELRQSGPSEPSPVATPAAEPPATIGTGKQAAEKVGQKEHEAKQNESLLADARRDAPTVVNKAVTPRVVAQSAPPPPQFPIGGVVAGVPGGSGRGLAAGSLAGTGGARQASPQPSRPAAQLAAAPAAMKSVQSEEAVTTQAAAPAQDTSFAFSKNQALDADAKKAKTEPTTLNYSKDDTKSEAALVKPAEAETVEVQASVSSRKMKTMSRAASSPRTWRVLSGKLQSSVDGGRSWTEIPLPQQTQALGVDAGQPTPNSVWVGGASGVVLRSQDNGASWTRVSGGWSGDVVYLNFQDAKRGTLRTSTHEEWFTENGSASWSRR